MRTRVLAVLCALVVFAASCATLDAQKTRLANDPMFARGRASPTPAKAAPTPAPHVTAAPATGTKQTASEKASAAIEAFNEQDERALGEAIALRIVAATLAKTVPTGETTTRPSTGLELRDQTLLAYVNEVGNLVALQGERQIFPPALKPRMRARRFTFAILDSAEVGAYSTPGGYVFITRGLLGKLTSESELAWVLGHEISHVDYEDGLSMLKADILAKSYVGGVTDSLQFIPGVAASTGGAAPDAAQQQQAFNAIADRFYDVYEGTGLARESEQRADERGLDYSTRAGYDGQGAARALTALAPPEGGPMMGRALGDRINRFVTHGSKGERLSEMKAHLDKPGVTGAARYDRIALARVEQLAVKP